VKASESPRRRIELCTPEPGESEDEFIGRCVGIHMAKGYPSAQAAAICHSVWGDSISRKGSDRGAEAIRLANGHEVQSSGDWQLILPLGSVHTRRYGRLDITKDFLQRMVDNWRAKVLGERAPFVDVDHDGGEAQGWITDMRVQPNGLAIKVDWTAPGAQKLQQKLYKYFSATIDSATDPASGDEIFPVLVGASLTNQPAIYMLPPAKLSENAPEDDDMPSRGDGLDLSDDEERDMEFTEILKGVPSLTDEQKAQVAKAAGFEVADDTSADVTLSEKVTRMEAEVDGLKAANSALKTQLDKTVKVQVTGERDRIIGLALSEGRMLPKDKAVWEKRYDASPDAMAEVIASLPKVVDLSERGTGSGGEEQSDGYELSEKQRQTLKEAFKLTDAQIDERILGKQPAKK
jgi:phage I-like protein